MTYPPTSEIEKLWYNIRIDYDYKVFENVMSVNMKDTWACYMFNLDKTYRKKGCYSLNQTIETVYLLENPQRDIVKLATGTQLKYDDIIKEVFGVACLNDLQMMIQYNKSFQECICDRYSISENKITLDRIIRVASSMDLLKYKNQLLANNTNETESSLETDSSISCPFDSIINLQEGIFSWDEGNSSYNSIKPSAQGYSIMAFPIRS